MTKILLTLLLTLNLYANIEISQNIRALYKNVKLTEIQKNYILNNQDIIIKILKKEIKKEIKEFKQLNEKNIIRFIFTPDRKITNIKFLVNSNNKKLDRIIKKTINKITKKLPIPKKKTELRYIIHYNIGKKITYNESNTNQRKNYYIPISNGTTRFEHSNKEYVRTFETSKDGFINANTIPQRCATLKLLTNDNQLIHTGYTYWTFNKEIPKGKYKLLIKTKKTCDISLQYL